MGKPANISSLVGRRYVTKSGKRCILRKLGDGALRIQWLVKGDSKADNDEVDAWIISILESEGITVDTELCYDENREAEQYAAWKRTLEGGQ